MLLMGLSPLASAQMNTSNKDTTGNYNMHYMHMYGKHMGHGMMNDYYCNYGMNGACNYGMMNRRGMHGMMMGQMNFHHRNMSMPGPMKPYVMIIHSLPDMQKQLSLTSDQTDKLIQLQSDFLKRKIDNKADIKRDMMKLNTLLKGNASSDAVKKQLEACENSKIMIWTDAYDTAMKMKNVLNKTQQQKFDKMVSQCKNMHNCTMPYCNK